jgi:hypothetical protein
MTVAHGWAHATTNASIAVLDQLIKIAIAAWLMPLKPLADPAHVMMDGEEKDVPYGSALVTASVMAVTDQLPLIVTSVSTMLPRMNMETVIVIGSGWVATALISCTREHVTQSA